MSKIGLALGSGAARGWSHIGVIEALEEEGIFPDIITGTSIGSIVGAVYACNRLPELKEAALGLDVKSILLNFLDLGMPRSGLIEGYKVEKFINDHLQAQQIENLAKPFACVATDLMTGAEVVFSQGNLLPAVRSSISMPGVFSPVYYQDRVLVDGGMINPVPIDVARSLGADTVIAVDINHGMRSVAVNSIPKNHLERLRENTEAAKRDRFGIVERFQDTIEQFDPQKLGPIKRLIAPDPIPNIFDVLGNSIRIMESQITDSKLQVHPADVLIRPDVAGVEILEFNRAEETIEAGYIAARAALPEIKAALETETA